MAIKRGATTAPLVIPEKPTDRASARRRSATAPSRSRASPLPTSSASALDPLMKVDDASGAEAQLLAQGAALSLEARAEAGTRVAFVYYVLGLDMDARRVADTWRQGATGEWASQAAWVSGLASWRLGDYNAASIAFRQVAPLCASSASFGPAAYYWAARAEQAAGRPRSVEPLLKAAATTEEAPESFYGLLARETLGMSTKLGRRIPSRTTIRRSSNLPTSSARSSSRRSASPRSPRRCSATRRRSARLPSITR